MRHSARGQRRSEGLGVVHRRRAHQRGRCRGEHERKEVQRPPVGPEFAREQEDEDADREPCRRRDELARALWRTPTVLDHRAPKHSD